MARVTVNGNIDFRKANNKYFESVTIKNATGAAVTLAEGSLLAFDKADGKYYAYPVNSTVKPVAIVAYSTTIGATSEVKGNICIAGDVNASALDLPGSYTVDSVPVSSADAISIAADAGNTGNGTAGTITQGSLAKAGTYELNCIAATVDAAAATTSIAAGGSNTGNGTAGAITPGDETLDGDYVLTCYNADVSGSEIFEVVDPNGDRLDDLTVGVAYATEHFNVTISDGATDFIVGDTFTVTATAEVDAVAGTFEVLDPDNFKMSDLTVDVAYDNGHFGVTISDGATNFVVGDKFTVTSTVAVKADGSIRLMLKETGIIANDVLQIVE